VALWKSRDRREDSAKDILSLHLPTVPFNEAGWRHILTEHGGKLPIKIKAIPEGTTIPTKNILFSVENTDPKCFWLIGYLETILVQCWYPCTVASLSRHFKKNIKNALDQSAESDSGLDFQFHDFGFRGVSSVESAGIGACANLVNFKGTDTMAGLLVARNYYDCEIAGFSVPASEHSTTTVWRKDGEKNAFENMLNQFESGIVSVVSDSYDIFKACSEIWGKQLKAQVISRGEKGNVLVVRPDSGDPATVVLQLLEIFGEKFGFSKNKKGYKVLPPYIRILQGDGINLESSKEILDKIMAENWSAENIVLGCGGGLLQKLNRDTLKFAFKCSFAVIDNESIEVYKDPITDQVKKSKKGKLALHEKNGSYETIQHAQTAQNGEIESCDILVPIFENGTLLIDQSLEEIRLRAQLKQKTVF